MLGDDRRGRDRRHAGMKQGALLFGLSLVLGLVTVQAGTSIPIDEARMAMEVASPWTPELITALFAGLATLITALAGAVVMLYSIKREQKSIAKSTEAGIAQVHTLVNSGNSALLARVSRALTRIAEITNDPKDRLEAQVAQKEVTEKAIATAASEATSIAATKK